MDAVNSSASVAVTVVFKEEAPVCRARNKAPPVLLLSSLPSKPSKGLSRAVQPEGYGRNCMSFPRFSRLLHTRETAAASFAATYHKSAAALHGPDSSKFLFFSKVEELHVYPLSLLLLLLPLLLIAAKGELR